VGLCWDELELLTLDFFFIIIINVHVGVNLHTL